MRTRQSRETVSTVPLDLIDFCCLYQNFEVNWDFYVQIQFRLRYMYINMYIIFVSFVSPRIALATEAF